MSQSSISKSVTTAMDRRDFMVAAGSGLVAAVAIGFPGSALASLEDVDAAVMKLVSGTPRDGRVTLTVPQIAENGATVPLSISVDSPMTAADHVKSIHLFAAGNPNPDVASFFFSPKNGVAKVSTRMRLAKTQKVVAVAEMSDGSVWRAIEEIKVTIGGCGG